MPYIFGKMIRNAYNLYKKLFSLQELYWILLEYKKTLEIHTWIHLFYICPYIRH